MTMRSVDTRFWADGWVRKLNALDRYLFLYLLTNDKTNWCGIYELDIAMMAFESGIDERDLERSFLPRLAPKVIYVDGWVYIPNYSKYHLNGTEATKKGYQKAFEAVPEKIRLKIKEIEQNGVVPPTHPSSALSFAPSFSSVSAPRVEVKEEISEENTKPKKESNVKYPNAKSIFELWGKYPRNWDLNTTQLRAAENLFADRGGPENVGKALKYYERHRDEDFCPQITSPYDLDSKWEKLAAFRDRQYA